MPAFSEVAALTEADGFAKHPFVARDGSGIHLEENVVAVPGHGGLHPADEVVKSHRGHEPPRGRWGHPEIGRKAAG